VTAIVGIMSAIAIPNYLSWKPGYISRGAVSLVQRDLNKCKMRALETRHQCRVVFTSPGYQIFDGNRVRNSSQWGRIASDGTFTNGTTVKTEQFSPYPDITTIANVSTITFSPVGTASPGSITVQQLKKGLIENVAKIKVNITGRVRAE
jgi:Tfp pilus assembly protein FimT